MRPSWCRLCHPAPWHLAQMESQCILGTVRLHGERSGEAKHRGKQNHFFHHRISVDLVMALVRLIQNEICTSANKASNHLLPNAWRFLISRKMTIALFPKAVSHFLFEYFDDNFVVEGFTFVGGQWRFFLEKIRDIKFGNSQARRCQRINLPLIRDTPKIIAARFGYGVLTHSTSALRLVGDGNESFHG